MTSPYTSDDRGRGEPGGYGAPRPEQPGPEQYGAEQSSADQYGAGQYGASQYGAAPHPQAPAGPDPYGAASWDTGEAAPAAPMGWTPAPRQGLFPLRPLNFGEIFGTTFKLLRTNPGVSIGSSAIISAVSTAISIAVPVGILAWAAQRSAMATGTDADAIMTAAPFWVLLAMVPVLLLNFLASGLMQAIIVQVVAAAATGERVGFKEAWKRAWQRVLPLLGYYAIIGGAAILATLPFVGVVFGIISAADNRDPGLAVMLGVLAVVLVLGLIVLAVWLGTKLLLAPSAIVLEGLGAIAGMRRSWRLVQGYFWRTLGISLLLQAIVGTVGQVVSGIGSFLLTMLGGVLAPTGSVAEGQEWALIGVLIMITLISALLGVIVGVLTAVLVAGNATIMYTDLRMRKEGLNIHLQQVVDDRAEGREPQGDPWTAPDLGPAAPPQAWSPQPEYQQPQYGVQQYGQPQYGQQPWYAPQPEYGQQQYPAQQAQPPYPAQPPQPQYPPQHPPA